LLIDLILKNAKIFVFGNLVTGGLAIDNGKIVKIAKEPNLPDASKKMDLNGLLVLPGLIDAHVHLRDQGLEYKEDFFTGTAAAANGGITSTIDMPNNKPITNNLYSLKKRMQKASEKTIVNLSFQSAFPKKIGEMQEMVEEGTKAFKLFMSQSLGGKDQKEGETLLKAFRKAAQLNVPVSIHAEDGKTIEKMTETMKLKKQKNYYAFIKSHSTEAEVKAINRVVEITKKSNARTHVCHVSTSLGTNIISLAKNKKFSITCEVTPHHLLLPFCRSKKKNNLLVTNPPIRTEKEAYSLWSDLERGVIDILVSDHAPHTLEEKNKDSIWEVAPGISGIETLLPLMLNQINKGNLSLSKLVNITSKKPAEIFRLNKRGILKKGNYADLVVIDLKKEWKIDSSKFFSKAKYSPFDGWRVKGKPMKTFVNGKLTMDDGKILVSPGAGRII
jgi:dihydroorotase